MNNQKIIKQNLGALKIAFIYLVIGSLWILFSDKIAEAVAQDRNVLTIINTVKGWGYVIVTSLLLYWLIQRYTILLRESDERRASIMHAAMDAIISVDNSQHIALFNPAAEKMFGYTANEIIGQSLDILIPEMYRTEHHRQVDQFGETGITNRHMNGYMDITGVKKNGDKFPIETSISQINIDGGKLFTAILRDVSGQKQAEEALQQSEEKFSRIFQTSPIGISISSLEDGRILDINPSWCEIMGYTRAEAIGHSTPELGIFDAAERARLNEVVQREGAVRNFECTIRRKSGEPRQILSSLERIQIDHAPRMLAMFFDITERKKTEEEIRSLSRFPSENPNPVFRVNQDGKILYANPAGTEILKTWADETHQNVPNEWKNHIEQGFESGLNAEFEFATIGKVFSCILSPIQEAGYINIYGQDITDRKKTDTALRQSEERFSKAFQANPAAMIITRMSDGHVIEANESYEKIHGYRREELLGKTKLNLDIFDHLTDRQKIFEQLNEYGSIRSFETKLRTKSGEFRDVLFSLELVEISVEACILAIFIDITERKRAETALRQSEERFSKAFQANPAAMVITRMSDGYVIDVNESYEKIYGYRREELLGKTKLNLDIFDDFVERQKIFEQLHEYGSIRSYETKLKTKSGEFRDVLFSLEIVEINTEACILAIFIDLTERKQAEAKLAERHATLRAIMESALTPVFSLDLDYRYTSFNKVHASVMKALYGADIEIGKNMLDYQIVPEEREAARKNIDLAMCGESVTESAYSGESGHMRRFFEVTHNPIRETNGDVIGISVFVTDVTERKQAEEAIQQLNETLEERIIERTAQLATVNKELESFAYSVSHDLRSPLRGIDGWSLALLEDYGPILDEQGQTHIHKVRTEVQRMGTLIDDILKLSRITRAEMNKEKVDLSALAETIVNRLQETKPKDKQVEFVIQKGLTALGDPELLDIVLTNLLDNAFKFTGKLQEAHIEFGKTFVEGENAFFVRDNGAGFDMAYATKLFGAFQRMHRTSEFPGTGVGLATVQRIITRHGGTIWASAEVDRGATFYFTLENHS